MKLRIRGNSVRFRLTRGELDALRDSGRVEEHTEFPFSGTLTYAVCVDDAANALAASFENAELRVTLPRALLNCWLAPQEVGVSGAQNLPGGSSLALLLEKDFPCLTPRAGEEDSDAFTCVTDTGKSRS